MFSTVPAIPSPDSMLYNDSIPALETDITQFDWSDFFSPSQSTGSLNETNQSVPIIDERKRRRMISNRDSARRSRMRKRNQLEKLTNEVKQLQIQNQELYNRLKSVSDQNHCLRIDNDRVRFESSLRSSPIVLRQWIGSIYRATRQVSICGKQAVFENQVKNIGLSAYSCLLRIVGQINIRD
ncbi:hypothetical protein F3Y22_tig00006753pilonHSYRG00039 [Hibiscus syriacus]|uniref:BZIP domain-containing protein n=1 Tax=Hibiscus syriacus TaxID=106335 RepID=A0A6A3CCP4_HIBSY|nr:hypothetical protein F3Y22_tig00006753pilonHSYRG00039 [Hibiscus syriacus]